MLFQVLSGRAFEHLGECPSGPQGVYRGGKRKREKYPLHHFNHLAMGSLVAASDLESSTLRIDSSPDLVGECDNLASGCQR